MKVDKQLTFTSDNSSTYHLPDLEYGLFSIAMFVPLKSERPVVRQG